MEVNQLAVKFNIETIKSFNKFALKILPDKKKYPFIHNALISTIGLYFDSIFKCSNYFFPIIESSLNEEKKLKKFIFRELNLNFISTLLLYTVKLVIFILSKVNLLKINFQICEIAPNTYKSSDLYIFLNFLFIKYNFKINYKSKLHHLIRASITSTLSPITVFLFQFLIIPLKINLNFIQLLKNTNPILLNLIEISLVNDLKFTKFFLKFLGIKKMTHTGWCSIKGSILFEALSLLNIGNNVFAHGHLSHPALYQFFPIKSSSFVVFSEEESLRLKIICNYFNKPYNKVKFLLSSPSNKFRSNLINLRQISRIILGFSTPDFLSNYLLQKKYEYLIYSLLEMNYEVMFRPHHQASNLERSKLSINNLVPIYKDQIKLLDKEKTLILGSCTTLLLNAGLIGIKAFEISDFASNYSALIKSVPCYTVESFLLELKNNQ